MEIELKDVIHFYIGQKANVYQNGIEQLTNDKTITGVGYNTVGVLYVSINYSGYSTLYNDIKPILRPLSDMTEKEKDEFSEYQIEKFGEDFHNEMYDISQFLFLLKQGFDIFGLIESHQAIDKTQLEFTKP